MKKGRGAVAVVGCVMGEKKGGCGVINDEKLQLVTFCQLFRGRTFHIKIIANNLNDVQIE